MQSLRLRTLQWKLAEHAGKIQFGGEEPDGWESDVDKYVKLVQDYEYMDKWSKHPKIPFLITGRRLADNHVLERALGGGSVNRLDWNSIKDWDAFTVKVPGPWEQDIRPVGGSRDYKNHEKWYILRRHSMALFSAIFLMILMIIMSFHNGLLVCLLTANFYVFAFGAAMAWFLSEPKEVMTNTAAYAAVLAVFVGLAVESFLDTSED
ncbi:hypothetical protein PG993_010922 [Apiospora rasikravindrae]|uniref:DUF6594 domain-containing protein n=1 Tax=Apiospora rasikravindrae TaxID=990691 RepID=A0ABR1SCR7_9PEZI